MNRYIITTMSIAMALADASATVSPSEVPVMYAPVSARATALGNALYCAEYESVRYNPAYLGLVKPLSVYGTYGALGRGGYFGNAAAHFSRGGTGWGVALGTIGSRFDRFTTADAAQTGTASVGQSLLSVAAGMRGDSRLLAGVALRLLLDTVDQDSNAAAALDAGAGYLFSERVKAGLVLHNAVAAAGGNGDDAPPFESVLAVSWQPVMKIKGQADNIANTAFFAVRKAVPSAPRLSLGWESLFYKTLAARLGYDRDALAFGVGFRFGGVNLDFAAALKEQGFMYFTTLGWRMSPPAEKPKAAAEREPPGATAAGQTQKQDKESSKAGSLAKEGWQLLREDNLNGALSRFNAALALEPGNKDAMDGKKTVEEEMAKVTEKESVNLLVAQAGEALKKKEYAKAWQSYLGVLGKDPESGEALEGLRSTLETIGRDMEPRLREATGEQCGGERVTKEDAREIADGDSFGELAAAADFLAQGKFRDGYAHWINVQPRTSPFVGKYGKAFNRLPAKELEAAQQKAQQLAQQGRYAEAVGALEAAYGIPGVQQDALQKAKGLAASYEYVGRTFGTTYLDKAQNYLNGRQYDAAAACLKRVILCGYSADEARALLEKVKAAQASPPAATDVLEGRSVRETLDNAIALYNRGEFEACRNFLLRVLNVEPYNSEARQYMEKLEGTLGKPKKTVPLKKTQ